MMDTSKPLSERSYLDLFSHLSRIIAQTTTLEDLIGSSVRLIQNVLQVENCSIMLVNPAGTALSMQSSSVIAADEWKHIHIPLGHGIAGAVARTGKAVLVAKSSANPPDEKSGAKDRKYQTDSYICVPLKTGDIIVGVVCITDHVDRRVLTSIDMDMLDAIARFIASAVHGHYLWVRTHESREHLSHTMDGLPVGLFTISSEGRLILCNRAARQYLNLSHTVELDKPWEPFFPELVRPHILRALKDISRGESTFSDEFEISVENTFDRRSVRVSAIETEGLHGEGKHVLFIVEDLQQMQELWELRRSAQMKSTFLSLISHELRTPLASIKGSIHLLNQMAPPEMRERSKRLFAILHRNSDRLARLVNNILDVMDLESENLTLYRKRTNLHELIMRVARKFENGEFEKHISWKVALNASASELYVDEGRFGQVVEHLLENAVKFTQDGGEIAIETTDEKDKWVLSISNSGREIAPSLREKVFTRFYQVDGTLTRASGGSGLGLYLCREIIRLHDGEIWVHPEYQGGTCLKVALPVGSVPAGQVGVDDLKKK